VAVGAKQICRKPGCTALIDAPGYCEQHKTSSGAWSHDGKTAAQRGYGYAWSKLRRQVMMRDQGLCQCDQCQGGLLRVTAAQEVDHIVPKSQQGTDDLSNLRAVSKDCHLRISAEQQGKSYRPKVQTGLDGWKTH